MAKRTNGEGTIYQRANGLWCAELTIGYDEGGKRIKKSFSSMDLDKLQKKVNDERYKLQRNIIIQKSDYTVYDWCIFWLENYKANTLKASTYDRYEHDIKNHIKESIGNIMLTKIRPESVQQLFNEMNKKGLSTSSITSVHHTLNQAFEQAIKNELIYINPCKATSIPKTEKRKARSLTKEEQERFLENCPETSYGNLFKFALCTGARRGEIRALTWQDIDYDKKTISISKTASTIVNRDADAKTKTKTIMDATKSEKGNRIIPINKQAERILNAQKCEPQNSIFIFSSKAKTMLMDRNITKAFKEVITKADLPNEITVHTLRHTFATRLIEKGANPKVISEILGHSSIQVTFDVYGHVMPDQKAEALSLLD